MLRVLLTGGGSGGHVTPAVAVVREILQAKPRAEVEFWTDPKYYNYYVHDHYKDSKQHTYSILENNDINDFNREIVCAIFEIIEHKYWCISSS